MGDRRRLPPDSRRTLARGARSVLRDAHARRWTARREGTATGAMSRADGDVLDADLEMLRRIDPEGGEPADVDGLDLEAAWAAAAASIVEEHNRRADPRAAQDAIGPAQRFALELLRDPTVILPEGAERAADALAVERSSARPTRPERNRRGGPRGTDLAKRCCSSESSNCGQARTAASPGQDNARRDRRG